jgi:hypothetical protein
VELRSARRVEWVLFTVDELGVLAHLPADPAVHRIDTTARHRPHPAGTSLPPPEPLIGGMAAWVPEGGWNLPIHTGGNGKKPTTTNGTGGDGTGGPPVQNPPAEPDPDTADVDDDAIWFSDDDDPEEYL